MQRDHIYGITSSRQCSRSHVCILQLADHRCEADTDDLVMVMTLLCYILTVQDCFRLYIRSFFIQLLIFIAYALNIPRFKPSANAISKRVLDIGLHAAPVGVPVIMVFCSIAAREWLKPKSIEELRPGTFKIVGETEVVAFDKTGTLTGSLVSIPGWGQG